MTLNYLRIMKAWICEKFGSLDELVFKDIATPKPAAGEVLIKVHTAALNFPDILMIQGKAQYGIHPPFVPGREFSGVITELGNGVSNLSIGDRVMTEGMTGALGELALAKAEKVYKLPENMSFKQGAGFMVTYGTAYHALVNRAEISRGKSIAILGAAGGVGTACIQISKLFTEQVIACVSSEEKANHCTANGATQTLNYSVTDLKTGLKELTDGKGVDIICDMVGGSLSEQAFRAIGWEGKHLVIGFTQGQIPSIPLNLPLLKGASLTGVFWSTYCAKNPEGLRMNTNELLKWFEEGKLNSTSNKVYDSTSAIRGYKDILERKVMGKIYVKMER